MAAEKFSKDLCDVEIIEQGLFSKMPDIKFLLEKADLTLITKLEKDCVKLGDVATTYQGIITGDNKKFLSNRKQTEKYRKIIRGKDIERYSLNFGETYVYFDKDQLWSNTDESMFLCDEKIISKASFNPEGKRKPESLTKQFDKFEVVGDYTYPILRIYGLEGKNEEEIYEITFRSRDLMLHVYSSLAKTLESKAKIKTLAELLAKTIVPVIKEVNKTTAELTPNILRKAEEEFEEWKRKEGIKDVEFDIVRISNEIEEADAEIDALVFELYGLDRKEVVTVLESLNVPEITENNILMKFGGANAM